MPTQKTIAIIFPSVCCMNLLFEKTENKQKRHGMPLSNKLRCSFVFMRLAERVGSC